LFISDDSKETAPSNSGSLGKQSKTSNYYFEQQKANQTGIALDGGIFMDATPANNNWSF
jgi:hypothetical protein